ncbi:MAG TPA: NUDIX domain-containing protein [Candidatus Methylomirabilis sp.]|nr:NUDIX domain-containing protein [Candidatus Methylomirabilis sp.]
MPRKSAGLLLYRTKADNVEVFLVHPGGPLWGKKDEGAWSIPKGEFADSEDGLEAAKREFHEETSFVIDGRFEPLAPVRQPSGKIVHAWCVEGDLDASAIHSNLFSMEWPPRSGKSQEFPEVDRGDWFELAEARRKILKGQLPLLEQLQRKMQSGLHANPRVQNAAKPKGKG